MILLGSAAQTFYNCGELQRDRPDMSITKPILTLVIRVSDPGAEKCPTCHSTQIFYEGSSLSWKCEECPETWMIFPDPTDSWNDGESDHDWALKQQNGEYDPVTDEVYY